MSKQKEAEVSVNIRMTETEKERIRQNAEAISLDVSKFLKMVGTLAKVEITAGLTEEERKLIQVVRDAEISPDEVLIILAEVTIREHEQVLAQQRELVAKGVNDQSLNKRLCKLDDRLYALGITADQQCNSTLGVDQL